MFKDIKIKMHDLIDVVINVLDARDPYTYSHSWRVARMSEMIAEIMGLSPDCVEMVHMAAEMQRLEMNIP